MTAPVPDATTADGRSEPSTLPALGLDWHERFGVTDELTGARYDWGQFNYVELDPYREPAHVFTVHRSLPAHPSR